MLDRFNRAITYLRISVTDRCNLRCLYCMPEEGLELRRHDDILSYEEIVRIASVAVEMGITKIRLTGGEPLVRRNVASLVRRLAEIEGVEDLAMTTNGTLLAPVAAELKDAGLHRLNISLDTLDPDEYFRITRGGRVDDALAGIEAAKAAGFPIKINTVRPDVDRTGEVEKIRLFCERNGLKLQLIKQYSLTEAKKDSGLFDRPSPCEECNRLRLLADGTLKPCLHSDVEIPIDLEAIESSIEETVNAKPKRGTVCNERGIAQIGG